MSRFDSEIKSVSRYGTDDMLPLNEFLADSFIERLHNDKKISIVDCLSTAGYVYLSLNKLLQRNLKFGNVLNEMDLELGKDYMYTYNCIWFRDPGIPVMIKLQESIANEH